MLLFTPGPVAINEEMRSSFSQPMPHHRTKDFEKIFQSVRENLKKIDRFRRSFAFKQQRDRGYGSERAFLVSKRVAFC